MAARVVSLKSRLPSVGRSGSGLERQEPGPSPRISSLEAEQDHGQERSRRLRPSDGAAHTLDRDLLRLVWRLSGGWFTLSTVCTG